MQTDDTKLVCPFSGSSMGVTVTASLLLAVSMSTIARPTTRASRVPHVAVGRTGGGIGNGAADIIMIGGGEVRICPFAEGIWGHPFRHQRWGCRRLQRRPPSSPIWPTSRDGMPLRENAAVPIPLPTITVVRGAPPSTRVIGVDASGWGCRLPLYCHDDLLLTRHTHTHTRRSTTER